MNDATSNLRRQPRQDRSRERVDTILGASQTLIGEKGLAALTMKEIAEASGMSLATVYHYFPNRSSVMAELYRRFSSDLTDQIADILVSIERFADVFRIADAIVDRYFSLLKLKPELQDLLNAIQADKELRGVDIAGTRQQADSFCAATERLVAADQRANFRGSVHLLFQLSGSAVRHALYLGGEEGERTIADYKRLIHNQLSEFDIHQAQHKFGD